MNCHTQQQRRGKLDTLVTSENCQHGGIWVWEDFKRCQLDQVMGMLTGYQRVWFGQTLVCTVEGSEREAGRIRWAKIRLLRDFGFYFLNLGELLNIEEEYYGTTCKESTWGRPRVHMCVFKGGQKGSPFRETAKVAWGSVSQPPHHWHLGSVILCLGS